jgi:hypothetical protein
MSSGGRPYATGKHESTAGCTHCKEKYKANMAIGKVVVSPAQCCFRVEEP